VGSSSVRHARKKSLLSMLYHMGIIGGIIGENLGNNCRNIENGGIESSEKNWE